MSALSRRKGRAFEQLVARLLRATFPRATVKRGWQAHGPSLPDVYVTGEAPVAARRCWFECQHARRCDPAAKLRQAERDSAAAPPPGPGLAWRPLVVWREHGAPVGEVWIYGKTLRRMHLDAFLRRFTTRYAERRIPEANPDDTYLSDGVSSGT